MKKKSTLTTGEFARLCKTTKETLFHYDRESLLKPKYVSENGYRRYGVEQFLDFDMITILKETGSTLKEIREYMQNMDAEEFLSLLEAKKLVVKRERERLAQREMMLRDMAAGTREALDIAYDTFTVQRQAEERLEVFQTDPVPSESTPEYIERYAKYVEFYGKGNRVPRYTFGVILERDDILSKQYLERYFFSWANRATPRDLLHIKPEGNYAVLAHKGSVQSHLLAFDRLLRQIQAAGLSVAGNAYVYDMMSYVLLGVGEKYAVKYCVHVE